MLRGYPWPAAPRPGHRSARGQPGEYPGRENTREARETSSEGSARKAQKKGVGKEPPCPHGPHFAAVLVDSCKDELTNPTCVPNTVFFPDCGFSPLKEPGVTGHTHPAPTPASQPAPGTPGELRVWECAEHTRVALCSTCVCVREPLVIL